MSDDFNPGLTYGDYPEDELDENGDWDPSGPESDEVEPEPEEFSSPT